MNGPIGAGVKQTISISKAKRGRSAVPVRG